ncbi:MAG TPA: SDR family oxidoreductase [Thermoanaerobaculia bacterium]|nr:SDR family oxidoreductase [Thermoanaerobaculia bacterium]
MATLFVTGFPGFLGSELVPRILGRSETDTALCLVQPKFLDVARQRAEEIMSREPALAGRIRLVEGDITTPGLGLADAPTAQRDVTEVYHLAAVYDLSVRRQVGQKVNVEGTRHVLDFAEGCPNLARFQYVSTCYVSGRYAGIFRETDLVKGQTFNNFYEETKFLAEVEVQERMRRGLPATVYRPAIVVGDSRTGATQKYDGPYFAIRWLLRQPGVALMPVVGDTSRTRLNLVPRDFVIGAIAHLSGRPESAGKVYQLADPDPLTIDEVLSAVAHATGRMLVKLPLPVGIAKAAIDWVPGVYRLMQIPSSSIDYFVHPTYYDTTQATADLAGSGLAVPPLRSYLPTLVSFLKAHPELGSEAMV